MLITTICAGSMLLMTGCNTVKGAFQGAGQDARVVSNQLQLGDNQSHSSHVKKKSNTVKSAPVVQTQETTTTTTTTTQ